MRLTKHTDYALRVLMYLAVQPDEKHKIKDIADKFNISKNHIMKVVTALASKGYIDASRGRSGGLQLARPPGTIRIGAVVVDMEPSLVLVECGECLISPACRLQHALSASTRAFIHALDEYTLEDLTSNNRKQLLAAIDS